MGLNACTRWTESDWQARRARHEGRLRPWVDAHLARQSRHEKHPTYDFLFAYYGFRPSWLMRWSPGLGVVLEGPSARDYLKHREYHEVAGGVALDPGQLSRERLDSARWILGLLEATLDRPPRFGCFGLHEWAMVYREKNVRHSQLPLRMNPEAIASFVESQRIVCSHYDAFRFFTPAARPLNLLQPVKATRHEVEQCGCLHANMDLFKWAHKFYPWLGSDLVADTFLLAVEIREIDMRASPYDVTQLGMAPITVENETGRAEYVHLQRMVSEKAQVLRRRVREGYRSLVELLTQS